MLLNAASDCIVQRNLPKTSNRPQVFMFKTRRKWYYSVCPAPVYPLSVWNSIQIQHSIGIFSTEELFCIAGHIYMQSKRNRLCPFRRFVILKEYLFFSNVLLISWHWNVTTKSFRLQYGLEIRPTLMTYPWNKMMTEYTHGYAKPSAKASACEHARLENIQMLFMIHLIHYMNP